MLLNLVSFEVYIRGVTNYLCCSKFASFDSFEDKEAGYARNESSLKILSN